jgi:8-oxo-dGTP pyrophosphatase MutT (NUDIX family)
MGSFFWYRSVVCNLCLVFFFLNGFHASGENCKNLGFLINRLGLDTPLDIRIPWKASETNKRVSPVVVVILQREKGHRVLMSLRMNDEHHTPRLSLPGGKLENGDSFVSAAIREVWEETGILLEDQNLRFLHQTIGPHANPKKAAQGEHVLVMVLEASVWENNPFNREGIKKMDQLGFYDLSQVPRSRIYDPQNYYPEIIGKLLR